MLSSSAVGSSLNSESNPASLSSSFVQLGGPMGDGLNNALEQESIAAFDELGAPFSLPADSRTIAAAGPSLPTRLKHFLAPPLPDSALQTWQFDFKTDALATEGGHLALTEGASRLVLNTPHGFSATLFQTPEEQDPLRGLKLSWSPDAFPALSLGAGYLHEQDALLGSEASGAFGHLSAQTLFLAAELSTTTPQGWQLAAQGEIGQVNPSAAQSQFITGLSTLSTSAFRLQARKPFANGTALSLSLASPLRVNSGTATLSLPTGRTKEGIVLGKTISAPLVPTGQQLDLTAMVELPFAGGDLSLAATRSTQPQHQRSAPPEWTFFTGYRTKW